MHHFMAVAMALGLRFHELQFDPRRGLFLDANWIRFGRLRRDSAAANITPEFGSQEATAAGSFSPSPPVAEQQATPAA